MAAFCADRGWGLLDHFGVAWLLAIPLAVIAMDFVIWLQHIMVHAVPALWRLHRVHHADPDYDLTTGARFHPLEIVLSMLIKFATIVMPGAPVVAVVIIEVLLNGMAMFNHGNIGLPAGVDRSMRWFFVTPDMRRVHHSIEGDETNSNFGFNLSWWDRLFGTYRDQPRDGQPGMTIGIRDHRDAREVARLDGMLLLPFRGQVNDYAINRRSHPDQSGTVGKKAAGKTGRQVAALPLPFLAPDLGHPRIAAANGAVIGITQRVLPVIVLMVFLGAPEGGGGGQFRVDVLEPFARQQCITARFGDHALGFVLPVDAAAVGRPGVAELAILHRGVDMAPEVFDELPVADLLRVVVDLDGFGMPGVSMAHTSVARVLRPAGGVARFDLKYAGQLFEVLLHAPEAAAGKYRRGPGAGV